MKTFEGKKIRDQILDELKAKIEKAEHKPGLAVICIGENPVCSRYVSLKKKFADNIGVNFVDLYFDAGNTQKEIIEKIKSLNQDDNIDGIMIQMPIPDKFDKFEIVHAVAPEKDVDGLRFCCSYKSCFKPPVVLAILEAIKSSGKKIENSEVVIVGRGFLVGWPLAQCLEEAVPGLVILDEKTKNLAKITKNADIIISAVGKHGIIHPNMIKEGVVLIDAGTTEVSGELKGDIDPACYEKASFYTPVPGGIGPVTIGKLFENLVKLN
jgi:methylenetetrahydrofolate dehydrogenase (NADP+) / methenyltetrahydrofolate cyclohydrolase